MDYDYTGQPIQPRSIHAQKPLIIKGSFIVTDNSVGAYQTLGPGLVTIETGLPAGSLVQFNQFILNGLNSQVTTPQSLMAMLFDDEPSAQAEGTAPSYVAGDQSKHVNTFAPTALGVTGGFTIWKVTQSNLPIMAAVNADGNLFLHLMSLAATLVITPTSVLRWRAELQVQG